MSERQKYDGQQRLVLVVMKDRETGEWWNYEVPEELCKRHGVELVRRFQLLEHKVMAEAEVEVIKWQGVEGVVAWLGRGRACKVKTQWWLDSEQHQQQRRWYCSNTVGQQAMRREQKRRRHLKTRQQRVVPEGWDCKVHPLRALEVFTGACKVEACYRQSDGKQGKPVVCFSDEEDACAARGRHDTVGGNAQAVGAVAAYSMRMVSCERKVVRLWWKQ